MSSLARNANKVLFTQIVPGFLFRFDGVDDNKNRQKALEMILESEQPMNQFYNFEQTVRHGINSAMFDGVVGT